MTNTKPAAKKTSKPKTAPAKPRKKKIPTAWKERVKGLTAAQAADVISKLEKVRPVAEVEWRVGEAEEQEIVRYYVEVCNENEFMNGDLLDHLESTFEKRYSMTSVTRTLERRGFVRRWRDGEVGWQKKHDR